MKPESLHALIIDRHFGELSPEAAELLEHHLAVNAAARVEAERILQSLEFTRDAVLKHPELGRVPAEEAPSLPRVMKAPLKLTSLARAAVVALLAALTGITGFVAGRSESRAISEKSAAPAQSPRKESPWARYRMHFDPAGEGIKVVRVDTRDLREKSIP